MQTNIQRQIEDIVTDGRGYNRFKGNGLFGLLRNKNTEEGLQWTLLLTDITDKLKGTNFDWFEYSIFSDRGIKLKLYEKDEKGEPIVTSYPFEQNVGASASVHH